MEFKKSIGFARVNDEMDDGGESTSSVDHTISDIKFYINNYVKFFFNFFF